MTETSYNPEQPNPFAQIEPSKQIPWKELNSFTKYADIPQGQTALVESSTGTFLVNASREHNSEVVDGSVIKLSDLEGITIADKPAKRGSAISTTDLKIFFPLDKDGPIRISPEMNTTPKVDAIKTVPELKSGIIEVDKSNNIFKVDVNSNEVALSAGKRANIASNEVPTVENGGRQYRFEFKKSDSKLEVVVYDGDKVKQTVSLANDSHLFIGSSVNHLAEKASKSQAMQLEHLDNSQLFIRYSGDKIVVGKIPSNKDNSQEFSSFLTVKPKEEQAEKAKEAPKQQPPPPQNEKKEKREFTDFSAGGVSEAKRKFDPQSNEDSFFIHENAPFGKLGGVFDGMGGSVYSQIISRTASEAVKEKLADLPANATEAQFRIAIKSAVEETMAIAKNKLMIEFSKKESRDKLISKLNELSKYHLERRQSYVSKIIDSEINKLNSSTNVKDFVDACLNGIADERGNIVVGKAGTTATVSALHSENGRDILMTANIGDSRIEALYKDKDGNFKHVVLTEDHNMLSVRKKRGLITQEQFEDVSRELDSIDSLDKLLSASELAQEAYSVRFQIASAIQHNENPDINFKTFDLNNIDGEGGVVLSYAILSDGVSDPTTSELRGAEMRDSWTERSSSQEMATNLVNEAKKVNTEEGFRKKRDDATAVVYTRFPTN